jgi:hypothetical protein
MLRRKYVEKNSRRGKGLHLVGGRHGCLKEQGANNIIDRANNAFSFTVLRRGVRAGYAKVNALGKEELPGARVVKLSPIVALDSFDAGAKLSGGVGDEVSKLAESVRFNS